MKNVLIGILIAGCAYPSIALSCKCDTSLIDQLYSQPEKAPVVFWGKIKHVKSSIIVVPVKSWTRIPPKLEISRGDACAHDYIEPDTNVLILIKDNLNSHKSFIINGCNSLLLRNHKSNLSVLYQLANKKDFVGEINPSWQFCESDKECIQVKNQCGNNVGVNNKYKKNYLDFLKTLNEKADCTKDIKIEKVSKCVEYFCS